MAPPSVDYVRRDPAGSVLQQIVREPFETFRAEAAHLRDGEGLPRFVEEEFKAFLRCGWLGRGSPGSGATAAAWIAWSPFPAKGAVSARAAAGGG